MMLKSLSSTRFDVSDEWQAVELCHQRGWTDGLPVIPPTEERVLRMVAASGRDPGDILGLYEERALTITVEKCAVNAVMAGCLPEYFPVVLGIVEGMMAQGGMMAAQVSTGGAALGFIINGPIRNAIGMNYQGDVLGPANRANSAIGRAIRLIQRNALGSVGGAGHPEIDGRIPLDRATLGTPAKHACYHIVENEEDFAQLNPLHVDLGFGREESVATVFDVLYHVPISAHAEETPEDIIDTIVHHALGGRFRAVVSGEVRVVAGVSGGAVCPVIIPPEVAAHFVRGNWSKADIQQALFEGTTRSKAWMKQMGHDRGAAIEPGDEKVMFAVAAKPEHIYPVIAGGPAGAFIQILYPQIGYHASAKIRVP